MPVVEEQIALRNVTHWIAGKAVDSSAGRWGSVWNPATGAEQARVQFANAEEVDQAVAAAKAAFPAWRATALSRRAEIMFRMRELVDSNRRQIAELLTAEHGKTIADALGEVARGLENIEFACGVPRSSRQSCAALRQPSAQRCSRYSP
jgi:malonate-semialdehyde dehydrogenase (acetylating) / methylmalonate-semialdehyde dehydrogenase